MLDWLRRRFGGSKWDLSATAAPWEPDRPAIAAAIEAGLLDDGSGLADSGMELPDEDRVSAADGVRYAAGARDGIALFHMDAVDDPDIAARMLDQLRAVLDDDGLPGLPDLYAALAGQSALSWIDELAAGLTAAPQPDANRLYALGLFLVSQAPDREAVKAGIAMLGMLALEDDDLALLRLLGSHDEFTLYAAVAIAAHSDSPEQELWSLARRVTGWGRIHAVNRLVGTDDIVVRAWLLREGFKNDVMERYLAFPCVVGGDLAGALAEEQVDQDLLVSAGQLLAVLLEDGGPTPGMESWEEGFEAVGRWLDHVARAPRPPLAVLPALAAIADGARRPGAFLGGADGSTLARLADDLRSQPHWEDWVRPGLESQGESFEEAVAAAAAIGLDLQAVWRARLTADAARPWVELLELALDDGDDDDDQDLLAELVDAADRLLPADPAAAEPADGLFPVTPAGRILTALLQGLPRCPGKGGGLVLSGLHSPVRMHRNLALRVLVAWPHDRWPADAHERVAWLLAHDDDDTVRSNAAAAWGGVAEA